MVRPRRQPQPHRPHHGTMNATMSGQQPEGSTTLSTLSLAENNTQAA